MQKHTLPIRLECFCWEVVWVYLSLLQRR